MKKYVLMLSMILTCLTAFSGCEGFITKANLGESSVSEKNADNSKSENKDSQNDNDSKSEDNDSSSEPDEQKPEETAEKDEQKVESELEKTVDETDAESENEENNNDTADNSAEEADIEQIGYDMFDKACRTAWDYLIACPYELDYEDTYEYAVRVIGVDSLADVLEDYNKVFTGECPELEEKYISTQYALYCYDGGRGSNIYYQNTELELVSSEDDKAVFNAISHYADPDTGEPHEDKEHEFIIVMVDDEWRVSEFTLPY